MDAATKLAFVTSSAGRSSARSGSCTTSRSCSSRPAASSASRRWVRWRADDGEMIPPNEFIPLAEELGLIEEIGDWVVEEIVRQDRTLASTSVELEDGLQPLASTVLAAGPGAPDPVAPGRAGCRSDQGHGGDHRSHRRCGTPSAPTAVLWELHARGLRVAIDDFGTGYSSLSRLRSFPIDVLKIDRSFVSHLDEDPRLAHIVAAFIQWGRGLGMTTLAEGIETEGEWRFLAEQGCELGPGLPLQPARSRRGDHRHASARAS